MHGEHGVPLHDPVAQAKPEPALRPPQLAACGAGAAEAASCEAETEVDVEEGVEAVQSPERTAFPEAEGGGDDE